MNKNLTLYSVIVLALLTFASCNKYQKTLRSSNFEEKYKIAEELYAKKDYGRALPLLEELVTVMRGTVRAERVAYWYAKCNYELGDYILASYHFKVFARNYPASQHAEEAMYLNAYCYYLSSPPVSLDQSSTVMAIEEFQLFINMYPASERLQQCNDLIDKLRLKLETKSYNQAKLYYNMNDYKASIQGFQVLVKDFPDTRYREEANFLIVKSTYLLAINSIEAKQLQRFTQTRDLYIKFIDTFPKSKYLSQAESIYDICNRNIRRLSDKQEKSIKS
jgi:outer membrane protein assembly factor BamD